MIMVTERAEEGKICLIYLHVHNFIGCNLLLMRMVVIMELNEAAH